MRPPHGGLCFARVPAPLTRARGAPSSATVKISEMGARAPLPRPHQARAQLDEAQARGFFPFVFLENSRCVVKFCKSSRRVVIFARLYFLVREKQAKKGQHPARGQASSGSPDAAARPSGTSDPDAICRRSCSGRSSLVLAERKLPFHLV